MIAIDSVLGKPPTKPSRGARPSGRRRWQRWLRGLVFRLLAVTIGLSPFVAAEVVLTIFDWGRPDYGEDPFVGFRAVYPLFVLFCLGGSTVQGRPFGIETSFTTWLEISLQAAEPDRQWDVIEHFRYNLRRMVQMTRDAGVPLLLVNPVCNLRDCAPFKTQHRDGLTPGELRQWESLVSQAGECVPQAGERRKANQAHQARRLLARAAQHLQQAVAIDGQHAGIHYMLAKCYNELRMLSEARESYLRAKELDVCPLRILEPINEAVLEVAGQTGTNLVDVRKVFEDLSDGGIPGRNLLKDHVHPSITGHRLIADTLAKELVRQGAGASGVAPPMDARKSRGGPPTTAVVPRRPVGRDPYGPPGAIPTPAPPPAAARNLVASRGIKASLVGLAWLRMAVFHGR